MFLTLRYFKTIACCLAVLGIVAAVDAGPRTKKGAKQAEFFPVLVNGRKLAGPNTTARRIAGRMNVPVAAIAREFGDTVSIDTAARSVTVTRQNGISGVVDLKLAQVRSNGTVLIAIADAGEIIISNNAADLLLPTDIAAALFEAVIRIDAARNVVEVERGSVAVSPSSMGNPRSFAELYAADYEYAFSGYSNLASHDLKLTTVGRLGDGRFVFTSNSNRVAGHLSPLRYTNFSLERPNGQRFVAGDLATGSRVQFLSANIRGGRASLPIGDAELTIFGGRATSGVGTSFGNRFDTNVYGAFYERVARRGEALGYAGGFSSFNGGSRRGTMAAGSMNFNSSRLSVIADLAVGRFDGISAENKRIQGTAFGTDIAATYQVDDRLALQGRYSYIGKNFMSPQSGSREPIEVRSAGVNWSPRRWFSTSLSASAISKPDDPSRREKFVTASANISPESGLVRIYASHTQASSRVSGASAFTIVNAVRDRHRWRLFLNATRVKTFGAATVSAQAGAGYSLSDRNSIELSQSVASRGVLNGQFDWRRSGSWNQRLSFSAGAGYSRSASGITAYERITASLQLPRQATIQANFINAAGGPAVLVSVRGSLFRKRESATLLNASVAGANSFAGVRGRVYQDVDLNGTYNAGIDKPQADVKVRIDGNRYVVSDAAGEYSFKTVSPGEHKVFIDLASVRADLTLLTGGEQDARLMPGTTSSMDFRLVRTGRLTGRVWLDNNENGKFDEGEEPLADIRVFTKSGRDTLTDAQGFYTIADLAPGEHIIMVDVDSLPQKTVFGGEPLALQVYPGRETRQADLTVVTAKPEVKLFGARPKP